MLAVLQQHRHPWFRPITPCLAQQQPFYNRCTLKSHEHIVQTVQGYINSLPVQTVLRGRDYHALGRVTDLECVEPGKYYAASVRGKDEYEVWLELAKQGWAGECSCPMEFDCKHIVAALLAIAESETTLPSALMEKPRGKYVPEPARSQLETRLNEHLGRSLNKTEAAFVSRVQALYLASARTALSEQQLHELSGVPLNRGATNPWALLQLWPEYPKDDYRFWLFVAWELRRRNVALPPWLEEATDYSLIEQEMRVWERKKAITHWQNVLEGFRESSADQGALELRLLILPQQARLQWRSHPSAPFADLKNSQAKDFADQYQQGALVIDGPSHTLWTGAFKPWSYDHWWTFDYQQASDRQYLNRILRMPLPPEQVVDSGGLPLQREPQPLRLDLEAPAQPDGDYHLALTTADGNPPSQILAIFPGRPVLYLTERCLFSGPPSEALGRDLRKSIPAAALETTAGVRFLQASGVPLPEHLRQRVRTYPVKVSIKCDLKPAYYGKQENIEFQVSASAPGLEETFSSHGWRAENESHQSKIKAVKSDEFILLDRSAQGHFPGLLAPLGLKWEGYPATWRLRLNKTTPELFATWLKTVPPEIDVLLDKELASLRAAPISGSLSLDIKESGIDWFDLSVALNVGDIELTPEELKLLLNAKGGYVRLGAKGWRRLQFNITPEDDEQLARLGLNPRDFSGEPQRFHALQLADEAASRFLGPERAATIQRRASELKTRVTPPLPQYIRAELRPYQTDGFHFLAYLTENRFGGVLADDMGLGKTLQTLAWLAWMREGASGAQPSLVVCPKSVMDNWRAEAERFYPELRVRTWHGEPDNKMRAARKAADLIVMNYSQLRSLSPATLALPWFAAVLDEAQYIKNPDSQTAQAARTLKASHRLALTGTPIENRLLDLWSIFGFAMPGVLGNRSYFLRRFDAKNDPLARRRLAARVRPFLLRRTKSQVAKDLPDRVEEDLFCEMEGVQQKLYRAELKRAQQILLKLKTDRQLNKERFNILTSLLRLRQICCHPALLDPTKANTESAKLSALEDLLEPLMEEGHKVLVFSQFVTMLDLLQKRMQVRAWPSFFLAGDTENRGDLVREFQSAQGSAVFLISLKAGGFGLNLTAASYVVLFDPWWNPAVENQAIDRTHRIGQANKVMAYRLLMRDSIEQKIRTLQKQKAALADDVLGEERFSQSLTLTDLQFLFED